MNAAGRFVKEGQIVPKGTMTAMSVVHDNETLRVIAEGAVVLTLRLDDERGELTVLDGTEDPLMIASGIAAAAEALFAVHSSRDRLAVNCPGRPMAASVLAGQGLAVVVDGRPVLWSDMVMQRRESWLTDPARPAFPLSHVMTDGKRHPLRPPKPVGGVYARFIPWLSTTVSFRVVDIEQDLSLVHRWLNDPRVDAFWNEAGDLDKHRQYLSKILSDPHMLPMIGCFGDQPFGYFELYWAKENRIAPFYDADDYDRGWHVIVGEDSCRGRDFITAWLPSLMHYMFLDDIRTQRIVGEPAAAHRQQLRNLDRAGFARIKNFDFPHKRATLVMLLRERFFGDRLWQPAAKDVTVQTQR
ncbi:GNAT family N-acetyltransferase [Bradyrhizobium sp. HKCCYLS2038]|uniref:GNAT family N-acetyltransferase n=1 Tax=unclassified Bradyrhizobium TaxID=2631580 RepID=UPI003EBF8BDE